MKNKQITSNLLMIEPFAFGYNPQTAENNYFQHNDGLSSQEIQSKALSEFNLIVSSLREKGISVYTVKDTAIPQTPDSIFPNNWLSTHSNGDLILYPMFAPNRRNERREDILDFLEQQGFQISETIDYTEAEQENIFLEGTGSMVLDRENKLAFASVSERTDEDLFVEFCEDLEYMPIIFHAKQEINNARLPIYHTNVMMCIAEEYAVICLKSIDSKSEKKFITDFLKEFKKEIIEISEKQMNLFAGNMLQIENNKHEKFLAMSKTAFDSLNQTQIKKLSKYNEILAFDIPTIEKYGGGSVRCMIAEIFLPKIV